MRHALPVALLLNVPEGTANCSGDASCDYEDTGLTAGTNYCYLVRTTYLFWDSGPSNTSCATTGSATTSTGYHACLGNEADSGGDEQRL